VAVLGPGDFFGEGALAGQALRVGSATATAPSTIFVIEKTEMRRMLHEQHALSNRFIAHLLTRNRDIEEDLIDQLFNRVEKRLARALLLLARYGEAGGPQRRIPTVSQETLAEMAGTTRSRVDFFRLSSATRTRFSGIDWNSRHDRVHALQHSIDTHRGVDGAHDNGYTKTANAIRLSGCHTR
jgi:hypothetical protein